MNPNKTFAALEKVVLALGPLDPEQRRQVIEAAHALVEIGAGRRGEDAVPSKKKKKKKR